MSPHQDSTPQDSRTTGRRRQLIRLGTVSALVVLAGGLLMAGSNAVDEPSLAAVPEAKCGPGSRPETAIQGRVPLRDYESGRAAKGYTCNTR